MSEYTTVYLRHKEMPLLKNKEYPSHEECQILSKEDLMEVICEIDEYNKQVAKSLGCKLFYLSTTPSRELTVLPVHLQVCLQISYLRRFYAFTKKKSSIVKRLLQRIKKILPNWKYE